MRRLLRLGVLLLVGLGLSAQTQETCLQCKWLPCLKSMRQQKANMILVYEDLRDFWKEDARTEGVPLVAEVDFGPLKTAQRGAVYSKTMAKLDRLRRLVEQRAKLVPRPEDCALPDDVDLGISTDSFGSCQTNQEELKRTTDAMPCAELANLLIQHEALHATKCMERWRSGTAWDFVVKGKGITKSIPVPAHMLTPFGQCLEEIEAYQLEITELDRMIAELEARCRPRRDYSGSSLAPPSDPSTIRSVPPRQAPPMPRAKPIPPPKPLAPPKPIS